MQLTLVQLCHACDAEPDVVVELVAHGVLDPQGGARAIGGSRARARAARASRFDFPFSLMEVTSSTEVGMSSI